MMRCCVFLCVVGAVAFGGFAAPRADWAGRIGGRSIWLSTEDIETATELPVLWGGSSPVPSALSRTADGRVTLTKSYSHPDHPDWAWMRTLSFTPGKGDAMDCVFFETRANRPGRDVTVTGTVCRLPPLPVRPDLKSVRYGEPIDLLKDGLDGFDVLDNGRASQWRFADGILENGGSGANIRTKRTDFRDFKLSCDVRVDKDCNSGVYLRGIYELQIADSFGKPVDSHNMAALYGRIVPSVSAEKPAGEWQRLEAILCRHHLTVWLNGTCIIDNEPIRGITGGALTTDESAPGPIGLQGDHQGGAYRNLIVTPILEESVVDVRRYGAVGDGVTKDTQAIQQAIDAVAEAGGGTVEVGAGTYLTGSLFLKSNVDFHLGAGAVLKGSPDPADYNTADVCPQNVASPKKGDNTSGGHLLLCIGQHHVTLRGPGKIDGNADAFLLDAKGVRYPTKADIPWRPAQMVWFVDSTDIHIEDVEIANAPYWSCFVLNCTRVGIRGCFVHTERRRYHTFNGDGLDIDRCQHVAISDCRVDTADDCITLRASRGARLANPQDCAFVTVANCSLSSSCNAVRPGVGEGVVRDCVLSDLVISDTRTAFNFVAAYGPTSRGPDIRGIRVSNVRIADAKIFLKMHHMYSREAIFRDITFSGISGVAPETSQIWAHPDRPFENIRFDRCEVNGCVEVVNADVRFEDGTLSEKPLTDVEKAAISEAIVNRTKLLH